MRLGGQCAEMLTVFQVKDDKLHHSILGMKTYPVPLYPVKHE